MILNSSPSRPCYVIPDCEEIDQFIDLDPQGRSRQQVFRNAGIHSGGRLFKGWLEGRQAQRSTLEALMNELHGCENISQITVNSIAIPDIPVCESLLISYRELILDVLVSPRYLKEVTEAGGVEKVEIAEFIWHHNQRAVVNLDLTVSQMNGVHDELCRMGWLRRRDTRSGAQYYQRIFYPRQCQQAYKNRVEIEIQGIQYAYSLSASDAEDGAIREFEHIVRQQQETLEVMQLATANLRAEPTTAHAIEVIKCDGRYHQGWGGFDPTTTALLSVGIGGHFQQIGRLIVFQSQLERQDIELPKNYRPLSDIVLGFYEENSVLYRKFLVATARSGDSIQDVLKAAREHANSGQLYVEEAEQLLKKFRPPGY